MQSVHLAELSALDVQKPQEISPIRLKIIRGASLVFAGAAWVYTVSVAVILSFHLLGSDATNTLAIWCAAPLQLIGILLGGYMLMRPERVRPSQRVVWGLLWGFVTLNAIATCFWNSARPPTLREELSVADLFYLADYWLLIAVFVVLFIKAGGSFRQTRVWLDAATMLSVQLVGIWSFFLAPGANYDSRLTISMGATAAYCVTLASLSTIVALVCLQLPNYRGRYGMFMLFGAAASIIGSEVSWLSCWLLNTDTSAAFFSYGDVLCMTCLFSAASAAQFQAPLQSAAIDTEKQAFTFLPALLVLLGIACAAGSSLSAERGDLWIVFGSAAVCVQLLLTRQARLRKELRELNQRLAMQVAEVRLTELVRRSSDLLVVIDRDGLISFASPAIEPMIGVSSALVQGTPAEELFGASHKTIVSGFLQLVMSGAENAPKIQLHADRLPSGARDLELSATDQRANSAIQGIVLTVRDISGQRAMEREVLDAVNRERIRLSADVHDGLGQDLTGIALLLHTSAVAPDPDVDRQRDQLTVIVGLVNRAIGTARDLARGYSPLHVVRGSLSAALRRLAQEASPSVPISLDVDSTLDDRLIGDFAADHLYWIAQEAVTNAQRHSGATHIAIALRLQADGLELSVTDDGTGIEGSWTDHHGLGLRLMTYRAELIGGTLRNAGISGHGARIEVTVPLRRIEADAKEWERADCRSITPPAAAAESLGR